MFYFKPKIAKNEGAIVYHFQTFHVRGLLFVFLKEQWKEFQ